MLGWFADAPDPDAGLLGFRRVSEALGSTHWYLALLRDAGATAERLARMLATSRFATDLLLRAPEAVALLADDDALRPRSTDELLGEMRATAGRADSAGVGGWRGACHPSAGAASASPPRGARAASVLPSRARR